MSDVILVLTTVADDARADALARALVDERLAACVNLHGPMASIYRWKGRVAQDAERQLIIKTTRARLRALEARLRDLHPYELPELLVLPVAGGSSAYLNWVRAAAGPRRRRAAGGAARTRRSSAGSTRR